jgi:hypothetical protein
VLLWSRANLAAAAYGERYLGRQYLRVRFEDLCRHPAERIAQIFEFVGTGPDSADRLANAATEVDLPKTIGRWRSARAFVRYPLHCLAANGLARLGYTAA